MWPFSGLLSGLYTTPPAASVTIYKAYIASTGTLFGPTGWSCVRNSLGYYTVDCGGLDLTVDGVAAWAIGHYVGEDSFATPNCNIKFSSVNRDTCDVWTSRSRDGGERDQAFYFYVAVGTADTVKKAILNTSGSFLTTPFNAPAGWTSSRISTGEFRITPTGGHNLTPGASEAAIHVQPYDNQPIDYKGAAMWEPESGINTQCRISTARLLDGALQDRRSYMVWIDGLAVSNLVEGVAVSNGSFTGTVPPGWGVSNPAPGRTDINPAKGNQPVQPVQDGLGWMASPRRGQTEQAGVTTAFNGTATIGNQTFRLLDGAATINKDFYFYALTGAAPE